MTRTTGAGSVIGIGLLSGRVGGHRQPDGDRGPEMDAGAVGIDFSAIGADERFRDPQAEARAGGGRGVARTAEKTVAELRAFLLGETDAGVAHRKNQAMAVAL